MYISATLTWDECGLCVNNIACWRSSLNSKPQNTILSTYLQVKPWHNVTPYLTLPSGQTGISCPALRSYLFDPVCIPNVTVGHSSLLEVLTNWIRERGLTLLSSSSSSRCDPRIEYLSCILAGHLPRKWNAVFSSPHAGHSAALRNFITHRCLLSVVWPVSNPTRTLSSCCLSPRADRVSCLSGPWISETPVLGKYYNSRWSLFNRK